MAIEDMTRRYDAFVRALESVDSQHLGVGGHSERVAVLTVGMAERADAASDGPFRDLHFSREHLQAIWYASLLHDIGMVVVPRDMLFKGTKLYADQMRVIETRFKYAKRTLEAEHLRAQLDQVRSGAATRESLAEMDVAHQQAQTELDRLRRAVLLANEPASPEVDLSDLIDLSSRSFADIDGSQQPLLEADEVAALSIGRGCLSEQERKQIESHVTYTFHILSAVPWTGAYSRIPEIVYAHHEKMDGSGYPRGLSAAEIPLESRMMTIADIFDALVAWHRPYAPPVPVAQALETLQEEAEAGKVDQDLLRLFIEGKVYESLEFLKSP